VQDEISGIIANRLRENLAAKEQEKTKAPVKNLSAYTHYLKGLHFWNKLTPPDTRKSIECFEKAIEIEPEYAQAYAMAASAYSSLGFSGQMPSDIAFDKARFYADKALSLDNKVAEGYIAKASCYLFYEWKWQAAYEALQEAIRLNPAAMETYRLLGFYYITTRQKDKAVETLEKAEQLDPLSPVITQTLGSMYVFAERYDDAITQAEKLIDINPEMRAAIEVKAWSTGMKGDWDKALKLFQEIYRLTNHPLKGLMGLGYAYAKLGHRDWAMECVRKLEQRQKEEPTSVVDGDLAGVWLALGNWDKTFYYLNQCIDKRIGPVSYFLEYPHFKDLKKDPRYDLIQQRMGL